MIMLDRLLLDVIQESAAYSDRWHFSFLLLYLTGCRHEETQQKYWSVVSSDVVLLTPAKHGKARLFSRSMLGDKLFFFIVSSELDRYHVARSTLTRAFLLLSFPYRIYRVTEMTLLHSFRYAYVFRMMELGFTELEIQKEMGHNDLKNTKLYMGKNITIEKI
jgi:hypothetical protein